MGIETPKKQDKEEEILSVLNKIYGKENLSHKERMSLLFDQFQSHQEINAAMNVVNTLLQGAMLHGNPAIQEMLQQALSDLEHILNYFRRATTLIGRVKARVPELVTEIDVLKDLCDGRVHTDINLTIGNARRAIRELMHRTRQLEIIQQPGKGKLLPGEYIGDRIRSFYGHEYVEDENSYEPGETEVRLAIWMAGLEDRPKNRGMVRSLMKQYQRELHGESHPYKETQMTDGEKYCESVFRARAVAQNKFDAARLWEVIAKKDLETLLRLVEEMVIYGRHNNACSDFIRRELSGSAFYKKDRARLYIQIILPFLASIMPAHSNRAYYGFMKDVLTGEIEDSVVFEREGGLVVPEGDNPTMAVKTLNSLIRDITRRGRVSNK